MPPVETLIANLINGVAVIVLANSVQVAVHATWRHLCRLYCPRGSGNDEKS
ncbi:MAG: hypothetical protein M3Q71_24080 [Chloroflexota bacterium]|nr:hypothetical protein [Actinomycetota bacterium]MDP9473702.1 hypothetical protein [Chloroflexota bacterium]